MATTSSPATPPPSLGWLSAAAVLFGALSVLVTWPAAARLDTHLIGGDRDGPMFLWSLWWAVHAVFEQGEWPLHTDLLFHPEGASLAFHTHAVLPSLLSAPLQAVLGLVPAYNLTVLATYVLSGLAATLLGWEVLRDRRAALVVGVAFGFCHFRSSFAMFLNLVQSQFLALFAWALLRDARLRRPSSALILGASAAALAYSSYNLAVLGALFAALFALGRSAAVGRSERAALLRQWGLALAAAALLVLPLGLELGLELWRNGHYATLAESKSYGETTPLAGYLVRGPLGGEGSGLRQASYLGLSVLALALVGLAGGRGRAGRRLTAPCPSPRFWALCAVLFLATSLGPELVLAPAPGGSSPASGTGLPLPFRLLRKLPLLDQVRVAHRYGIVGALALAVLAGAGTRRLTAGLGRRGASLAAAGLALVVFADFLSLPFPRLYELPPVPAAVEAVARDGRQCSVLEFPAGRAGYKPFSHLQTLHAKPVYLSGQLAREAPALERRAATSPLLNALRRAFRGGPPFPGGAAERAAIAREARAGRIGWVFLAATDYRQTYRRERPLRRERLEAMVAVVRGSLEVEEVLLEEVDEALAWRELEGPERRSADCVFAVYKLSVEPD